MKRTAYSLKPMVYPWACAIPVHWEEEFGRSAPLDVEIGFGCAEFLIQMAHDDPQRNWVGIEQDWERIFKSLKKIHKSASACSFECAGQNLKIVQLDAQVALEKLFLEKSIDRIYCLFPCPWPKRKHVHHRLFSTPFLNLLNNRLKEEGFIQIVTDFYPFVEWLQGQNQDTGLRETVQQTKPKYNTKFERKWISQGQEIFWEIQLVKKIHKMVPWKEDAPLKTYRLENNCVERFLKKMKRGSALLCHDNASDYSVVCKDLFFDKGAGRLVIQLFVSEEHIRQYFWVELFGRDEFWYLKKKDGQQIIPTPGLAQALEIVFRWIEGNIQEKSC